MTRSLLALVLLAGCPHPPAAPTPVDDAPVVALDAAPRPTIARVVELHHECSGAGGLHAVFAVLDDAGATVALAHWGGHAYWADRRFCLGDRFTVDYVAAPRGDPDPMAGCLDDLPTFEGSVTPLAWIDGPVQPQPRDDRGRRPTCAGTP